MSDLQGLMMKLEGSDNGAGSLEAPSSNPESQSWLKYNSGQFQQVQIRLGYIVVGSDNGTGSLDAPSSDLESRSWSKYISGQFQQAQIRTVGRSRAGAVARALTRPRSPADTSRAYMKTNFK
ncbi:hypothetical protein EVAR_98080_1 [Eumeta japonica]|uniref:Uncharacterized protein n=1 Tax=Eumeta variegata TaxID=151549 RepID=A0A4C1WBX6_EUMVA|nr:hypothetical protein EVAR_98080_1 [Eumeta japonica]